ncbi:MAG: retropepsin-like domain-containing protein [Deltaproteobacteria bacterium]|nr:retropepsin-like domain-containing protein [Nannocystaceae bacterium]
MTCVAIACGAGCLRIPDDMSENPDGTPSIPASAEEVLERHIRALGGAPKLQTIKQRTVEARMVFRAETGCEEGNENCFAKDQTGSFVLQTTSDGRLYRRTVLGDSVEERGYDGKTGWSLGSDGILQLDSDDERIASREDALLHWYFDVAKRGIDATLLTPRKLDADGRVVELDGVLWRVDTKQPPKAMWFDRKTGLLHEEVVEDGDGENARTQTIIYDDYQSVDGVKMPFKIRVVNRAGTREQVVEFVTQRANHGPVEVAKFAIPKLTKPEPQADPILTEVTRARAAAAAAPKDEAVAVTLARAEFTAAHFDEAIAAANATLAIAPREPEALFILARAQMLKGDLAGASRTLVRAGKAGVREDAIARQQTWILLRKRDYPKLGKIFDELKDPVRAGRYRAFVGKPFAYAGGSECVITPKLLSASPLVVPEIQIGGKTTGAILDTGSAEIILGTTFAKEIGVVIRTSLPINDSGDEIGYGQVDALVLGGAKLQNVPVAVLPDSTIAEMAGDDAGKIRAVIGANALSDFLITVDVPGKKLELVASGPKCKAARDARRAGAAVPFWLHESHYIYLRGLMGPAEGIYLLNTGMHGADLAATPAAFAFAGIGAPPIRSDEAPMVTIDAFSLAGVQLSKLAAAFGFFDQTQTSDAFRLDGMVGLGTLGQKRFTLDYENQKIWMAK